ncbi:MAG: fatty acid desaturase [Chitinophagaceae bacterium]
MPDLNKSSFTEALYAKADRYFGTLSSGKYATGIFYIKSVFLILAYISAYVYFIFFTHSFAEMLLLVCVLGICHVFIPVNISHDAIHESISSGKWINVLGLYGFEITGSNSYIYSKKHLEAHYNKENGSKTIAIESQGLIMQKSSVDHKVNLPVIFYLFYAQYMIFLRDFVLYFQSPKNIPTKEFVKLFLCKAIYCIAFIVLPFVYINMPWWQIAVSLLFMYFIVTVVLVIILLMPTEKIESTRINNNNSHNEKWVMEILKHNVDFSPKNVFLNRIVGGANLNVVHYLFPSVNHIHYNKLAAFIEETANEYDLRYRKQEVKDVFGIHFNYMKNIQSSN